MARPKCPNHTVEMEKTDEPRVWICPISGARFEADSDEKQGTAKKDKFGNVKTDWLVKPIDDING